MIVRGSTSKKVIEEKARIRDHGGKVASVRNKYRIFVGVSSKKTNRGKGMRGHEKRGRVGRRRIEKRETYARVLDYLPYGHPDDKRPGLSEEAACAGDRRGEFRSDGVIAEEE